MKTRNAHEYKPSFCNRYRQFEDAGHMNLFYAAAVAVIGTWAAIQYAYYLIGLMK